MSRDAKDSASKEQYAGPAAVLAPSRADERVASLSVSPKLRQKVPAEIWSAVWSLLPSFWDLVYASHVCTAWRATAIADGRLWSSPKAHLISPQWPSPELSPEQIATQAQQQIAMLALCLERAGPRISVSLRVDHDELDPTIVQKLIELINARAKDIFELSAKFRCRESLSSFVQGLLPMPALLVLRLEGTWGLQLSDLPFSRFPALEELSIRPYSFYSEDADTGLAEGKNIVPQGRRRGRNNGAYGDKTADEILHADLEADNVIPSISASARASLPALQTLTMGVSVPVALVCALRDWLPLRHLTAVVSFAAIQEKPSARHLSFIRSKLGQLDSLDLICSWDSYYRVRGAIPQRQRPATLRVGLHTDVNYARWGKERELGLAIMDVFDLSPAPISLDIEPCDTFQEDFRWRKHVLMRAHDAASGRIRQISIHAYMVYEKPAAGTWSNIRQGLGMSPLISLTVPWNCVELLLKDAKMETTTMLKTVTILITGLERHNMCDCAHRLPSTAGWPVLPALQHLTFRLLPDAVAKVGSGKTSEDKSPTASELREAIRCLVPAPGRLQSLWLNGVRTSSKEWEPILDLAHKVYDILLD